MEQQTKRNKISSCFGGCFITAVVGFVSIFGFPLCCVVIGNMVSCVHKNKKKRGNSIKSAKIFG